MYAEHVFNLLTEHGSCRGSYVTNGLCFWGFRCSRMWCHITAYLVPDVAWQCNGLIFRDWWDHCIL